MIMLLVMWLNPSVTARGVGVAIFLAIFLLGVALWVGIFVKLRELVLAPLSDLATQMAANATGNKLLRRAEQVSNDEVGLLADACNRMLERIERNELEKDRLIADLHDGAGGIITNINLIATTALQRDNTPEIQKLLTTIEELSREGVQEIRSFIYCVESHSTDWQLLTAEMRRYGRNLLETGGVGFALNLNMDDQPPRPGSLFMLQLWRVFSEALNNILKHASAKTVVVSLRLLRSGLIMEIHDDGTGTVIGKGTGTARGIASMRRRAVTMGGSLDICPHPRGGTRVKLEAPYEAPPAGRKK